MVYTARELEDSILRASAIRRIKGDKTGGDDGYWTGGFCNWGGTHNLKEDCQKLVKFFDEIVQLRHVRKDLLNFTSEEEFEKVREDLIVKIDKIITNLSPERDSRDYIAGVCCIWNDFDDVLKGSLNNFHSAAVLLKKDIEKTPYNEIKELKKLEVEAKNLQKEIEENERKARNETDPDKKKHLIFFIDEAKEKLKKNLERKKQLKSSGLGDNFNPDQYINEFFTALEDKLTGKSRPSQVTRNPNNSYSNAANSTWDSQPNGIPSNGIPTLNNNNQEKAFLERYWKELAVTGGFLFFAFLIYNERYEKAE